MYKRGQRFKEPTIDCNRDNIDFESLEDEDLAEYLRACKNSRKYSGYSTFYKREDGQYDFQTQYSHMEALMLHLIGSQISNTFVQPIRRMKFISVYDKETGG